MQVVNVKVKYIRPKYKNLAEWMKDSDNEYIGRKGIVFIDGERYPKTNSKWCNPYKITGNETRDDVIKKYRKYIIEKIEKENLYKDLKALKNKRLGCWCHPEACHGDVLIELINSNSCQQ